VNSSNPTCWNRRILSRYSNSNTQIHGYTATTKKQAAGCQTKKCPDTPMRKRRPDEKVWALGFSSLQSTPLHTTAHHSPPSWPNRKTRTAVDPLHPDKEKSDGNNTFSFGVDTF